MMKYNKLKQFLLVGALLVTTRANPLSIKIPIEDNLPRRILYLNEQNQIFLVSGEEDVPYDKIKILKGKQEIKMNEAIDYQYQKIKDNLEFKRKLSLVAPVKIPRIIPKPNGDNYSNLELKVAKLLYDKEVFYPRYKTAEMIERGDIEFSEQGIYFTIYGE